VKSTGNFSSESGDRWALLAAKALHYDPVKETWEKRIARYFSWQWRIRASGKAYFQPFGVKTLLEVVGDTMAEGRPARCLKRFEGCLDRLSRDRVISGWQYHGGWPTLFETIRWKKDWLAANIIVEPPDQIRDAYLGIGNSKPAPVDLDDLGQRIRNSRESRGLTVLRASEQVKLSPSDFALIEIGRKRPSSAELVRLERWLAVA
jgi:hypothetical protein